MINLASLLCATPAEQFDQLYESIEQVIGLIISCSPAVHSTPEHLTAAHLTAAHLTLQRALSSTPHPVGGAQQCVAQLGLNQDQCSFSIWPACDEPCTNPYKDHTCPFSSYVANHERLNSLRLRHSQRLQQKVYSSLGVCPRGIIEEGGLSLLAFDMQHESDDGLSMSFGCCQYEGCS